MSSEGKFKIPLPAIAVAVILIAGIVGQWYVGRSPAPSTTTEFEPEPATEYQTEPAPRPEPIVERDFVTPAGPTVTPTVDQWFTYHGGTDLVGASTGTIARSPSLLWRFQTEGSIYHTPVADEHGIYVPTLRGRVYGLDFDGNERWSRRLIRGVRDDGREIQERFDSPIAVFLGMVIVGSLDGTIYAFDSKTGEDRWRRDIDCPILGTPNLYVPENDPQRAIIVFVGQDDGTLYALSAGSGEVLWTTEAIDRCDGSVSISKGQIVFGSCAAQLHVFSAANGDHIKNIDLDPDSQVASGAAVAGDSVFAGSHSGRFFHASLEKGDLVWISENATDEIFSTPALSEDLVVFSALDGNTFALDRATGAVRWTYETDGYPTSAIIAGDTVAVGIDGVLHTLALESGEHLWSYEISDEISSPAVIRDMLVVGSEDGTVTAFGAQGE